MDRQRIINLIAAIAAITVFGFTLGLMYPLLSLIMEQQHIRPDMIGYNTAMQPVGIMISIFAIPLAVKKFGAKFAVIGSGLATAVMILAYPFASIFWWWFGLRLLHGFFVSALFAISEAWIVKFSEGPWRGRILAIYTSVLAASFGAGPSLISVTGINGATPFVIGAIVLVLATIPIFFVKDEAVDEQDERPSTVLGFLNKAPMLLTSVLLFATIDAAFLSFLPVYCVAKGFGTETAALSLTAFIGGNTVLLMPIGWLADHFNKRHVMTGCFAVTALTVALLPLTFGTVWFWVLLVVGGAASGGIYTVALGELGDRFSGHELTTGTASFSATWGTGAMIGSLGSGLIFQIFGPDGLPYTMAALFAAFALSRLALSRDWTTPQKAI